MRTWRGLVCVVLFCASWAVSAHATMIQVDPETVRLRMDQGDGHDTYARSHFPGENKGDSWSVWFGKAGDCFNRGYFKFDELSLLNIAGTDVISAQLHLFATSLSANLGTSVTTSGHRVTSLWDEATMTGSTQPTVDDSTAVFTVTELSSVGGKSYEVTDLVKGWLSGSYPNYGIRLAHVQESTYFVVSSEANGNDDDLPEYKPENRPYLEITYLIPEAAGLASLLSGGVLLRLRRRRRR